MARVLGGTAALVAALGTVLHAVNQAAGRTLEPSFWLLTALGGVAFGGTAVLLAGRVPRLPVLMAVIGLGEGGSLLAREYALLGPGPLDGVALWLGSWLWAPAHLSIACLLPLLLPDGSIPPRRWAWGLHLSTVVVVGQAVLWAVTPYDRQDAPFDVRGLTNPVGVEAAANPVVVGAAATVSALAAVVAFGSLVARWRAATGEARQQLKWLAVGGTVALLLFVAAFATPSGGAEVVAALAVLPIPVAVVVAGLRARLWEVDLIVSAGLRYAALSAVVIAVYAAVVALLGARSGAPVVATAVAAVVLLPVHDRVRRWANEWVHGESEDPGTALARLGDRLEGTTDPADLPDRLLPMVADRVAALLRSSFVAVELADGGGVERGTRPAAVDRFPLTYAGAQVGSLTLEARSRSASERRLLERLAEQAAVAVHSVLLAREARSARQEAVAAREEERRRLRRDLHDGVGPVVAGLALQAELARDLVTQEPERAAALLAELAPRLNGVVAEVRTLVHDLRPPTLDELGLAGAVRELAVRFRGAGREVSTIVTGPHEAGESGESGELGELPAAVELAAYLVVGEALSNAVRHGDPGRIEVRLRRAAHALVAEICDDGAGVPVEARPGVGLRSMGQRAEELGGRVEVTAGPGGHGTVVLATFPIGAGG